MLECISLRRRVGDICGNNCDTPSSTHASAMERAAWLCWEVFSFDFFVHKLKEAQRERLNACRTCCSTQSIARILGCFSRYIPRVKEKCVCPHSPDFASPTFNSHSMRVLHFHAQTPIRYIVQNVTDFFFSVLRFVLYVE